MRTALLAASLVLVAGTTVGCGGGAPTDASKADFCGTFEDFYKEASELGDSPDDADVVKALKGVGDKLEEVGTPEDMPDDAREGFELTVQAIKDIDDEATQEEIAEMDSDFSKTEQEKVDAFDEYLSDTCDEETEE